MKKIIMKTGYEQQSGTTRLMITGLAILLGLIHTVCVRECLGAEQTVTISAIEKVPIHTVAAEVLKVAYQRIGYQAAFTFLPARRALIWANDGITDGDVARIPGTEKKFPNLVQVPTPVTHFKGVVFTKTVSKNIEKWDDLRGLRIGIIRGIRYSAIGTEGMSPVLAKDTSHLLTLLKVGRIEVAVATRIEVEVEIARNFKDDGIHIVGSPLHASPLYHFVNIRNKQLIPQIDAVIRDMTKNGAIDAIYKRVTERLINQ